MQRLSCFLLLCLGASGCPISAPYLCDESMVLQATADIPPVISWNEESVQSLWVHDGQGTTYWDVRCPDAAGTSWEAGDACISSPVTYGIPSEGAAEEQSAASVTAGMALVVEVYRVELGTSEGCWIDLATTAGETSQSP